MVYGPVVVGVDDLEHSSHALAVGAREALVREVPLWLVHAYHWIPPVAFGASVGDVSETPMRASAAALLDEALAFVRADHPGLAAQATPVFGAAPVVLNAACADASLVVVGSRGRGGFAGLMLGSTALRTVSLARVPTMVVRGEGGGDSGHVLIGVDVDDPASGPEMLEFAFAEAELRKAAVHVVHVWDDGRYYFPPGSGEYVVDRFHAEAADRERRLDALLAPWREKFPAVSMSRQLFPDSPPRIIVESSRLADLVVLGGRIRGDHEGIRLGALAHTVLRHAHCPVVIVPEH